MARFAIQPHERLADWVAHENGYFAEAGLDYEIAGDGIKRERTKAIDATTGSMQTITAGAFEAYEAGEGDKGERSDISCACHWAVNQAAASDIGKMWGRAYTVAPGAIMVPPDSPIMSHILVRYSLRSSTSSTGVRFSDMLEKLATSEKKAVITRKSPPN